MSKNTTDIAEGSPIVCYAPTMITTNGIWQGDNPLDYSLPLFILQLTLVVTTTRILVFILKPLRQPRVIAEILGGVILGPSLLGRNEKFAGVIFPLRSVMVLETMANIGLLYFLFLVGVEMDLAVIRRTGRKAISIAIGGMILPFIVGCTFSLMTFSPHSDQPNQGTFVLFLGVALAVTAFPVLARILAELKLINTEMGRIAMSSALVNDICAWILLAVAIALSESGSSSLSSIWVMLASIVFVLACIFVVRPAIKWMIRRTPEGEPFSDFYICLILTGVLIAGFATDAIGTHSVFGAFMFGLVIPNGPLGVTLVEKLEDFVSGLLLPLFFAISGLKTDVTKVDSGAWIIMLIAIFLGCSGKVAGTAAVSYFYKMPLRDGITLGLLMNTKGLVEMIVLNVGKDQKVLDDTSFSLMVIAAVIMTAFIGPLVTAIYRPARRYVAYKRRTIIRSKPDAELRVLTCVHTPKNVPTIINLLEDTNPTKRSPICVYVLHLVELTGRASAMLIVHNTRKSGRPAVNRTQAQSDHIVNAFESYEQNTTNVFVQTVTAISPYATMHEDICNLAEDKRVSFIIIPFHKQQTVDGAMEATNPSLRLINQNLMANAPCSVGILVDRGLAGPNRSSSQVSHSIAVLYFGGPDDREALAYAWRMSEHPTTKVNVMRFVPGDNVSRTPIVEPTQHDPNDPRVLTVITDNEHERQLDDEFINDFRAKTSNNESVTYTELSVNNGEETVAAIRSMESVHDLFIVGRGQGFTSPLTAGLTDWSECPELGAIGDMLASSDFAATVSVLVVQQYIGAGSQNDVSGINTPDSPAGGMTDFDEQLNAGINKINHRQHSMKGQDIF